MYRSSLAFAFLAALPALASAQIGLVHVTPCGPQAFPSSTCTIPSTGNGNLVVVSWSSTWGTTPTISGVTDNVGNAYTEAGNARAVLTANDMVDFWYARNSKAGATSLTITPNPAGTSGAAVIWEFSNVDTVSPLDQTSVLNSQAATATPSGASVTTSTSSQVVISALVPGGTVNGIASGNAFTNDLTFFGNGWGHQISSSAGTYGAQWSTTFDVYASSTVSFKAAGSGSTGTFSACDLNRDGLVNVVDVQVATNMYLGLTPCSANIAGSGVCSAAVVQQVKDSALGGSCVTSNSHTVTLNWTASTTPGVSYNVYRSTTSGGPYAKLTTTPLAALTYVDSGVVAGQTYYYVTTAVDGTGTESVKSNEAQGAVPFP
jgi:hypothetical protein